MVERTQWQVMGIRAAVLILLVLSFSETSAQEFAREVSQFVGDNARPFLQPVADAVQSNIHAGLFGPAFYADGLHIGVQLTLMAIPIPDDRKTFTPNPFSKTVEFTYNGLPFLGDLEIAPSEFPTAVGLSKKQTFVGRLKRIRPKGSPYIPGVYDFIQQNATVSAGGYQDISTMFFAAPQLTIGSLFGTEIVLRYLPSIDVPDVGEVGSFGIGLRHGIGRYVQLPVDVSVQAMYQSMSMKANDKEYNVDADLSAFLLQLSASRTFPFGLVSVSPYLGVGYESSSLDVSYVFADPYVGNQQLAFESGGQFRFAVGANMKIWKVAFNLSYAVARMNGYSLAFGVEF